MVHKRTPIVFKARGFVPASGGQATPSCSLQRMPKISACYTDFIDTFIAVLGKLHLNACVHTTVEVELDLGLLINASLDTFFTGVLLVVEGRW